MSLFDTAETILAGAIDTVFGIPVLVLPRVSGNAYLGGSDPDPSRPQKEIIGTFTADGSTVDIRGQRGNLELHGESRVYREGPEIEFSAEQLAALGYEIRQGDCVQLLDRPGTPTYSVALVEPLGSSRIVSLSSELDP